MRPSRARRLVCCALLLGISATPESGLLAAGRPVALQSADGTSLTGLVYEPSDRPAPGIVLVHMLGRSKDDWNAFAERLREAGANVLALDLRGHGGSAGAAVASSAMVGDVRAGVDWLAARPTTRPGALAIVGASLGANLAAAAAVDHPNVRALALLSPALDYRGVRLDAGIMRKLLARPVWLAASVEDPYALRTVRDLMAEGGNREQHLTAIRAHGSNLVSADPDLAQALVDWLKRTLIF